MYRALFLFIVSCFLSLFTFSQSNNGLDPTFADSGRVRTYLPAFGFTWGDQFSTKQDDGKIITARQFISDLVITRHTPDGLLDYTWGTTGYVTLDTSYNFFTISLFDLGDLIIQENGKVLILGTATGISGDPDKEIIIRLNSDGSFDNTFDGDGIRIITSSNYVSGGVISSCISNDNLLVFYAEHGTEYESYIKAFNLSDGSDNNSWGNGGEVVFDYDRHSTYQSIFVQEDGKILLAGMNKMLRFLPDGFLDPQFAQNGKIMFDNIGLDSTHSNVNPTIRFGLQSDKSIVVTGIGKPSTPYQGNMIVQRLDSNGVIDNTFAGNGVAVINPITNNGSLTATTMKVLIHSNDAIVLVYEFYTENGSLATQQQHFALKKLHSDGTIDSSFGNNGIIITSSFYEEYPYDYVFDGFTYEDDKIVVVGNTRLSPPNVTLPPSEMYDINVLTMSRYYPHGGYNSIAEENSNSNFKVYPNPAQDRINIEFELNTSNEKVQLEVYSLNGKMIHEESGNSNTINSIDISELSSGVYILKIQQGEIVSRQKFVKQ